MKSEEIKTVAVIGAGAMGQQIAMNAALNCRGCQYRVYLCDSFLNAVEKAKKWAGEYLAGQVLKGRISQERANEVAENLIITSDIDQAVKQADLIMEAIIEKLDTKREVLRYISQLCKADAIIGTNSSNIVSSKLADVVQNPKRLMNIHFFNPALVMQLVELVKGPHTAEETVESAKAFVVSIGKTPIIIRKEIPGFVVNRINAAVANEACSMLEHGVASVEDIDIACEKGLNYPMGPFRLMDLTGIDVNYLVRCDRYSDSGDERDKPNPLVEEKYKKGEFGRKTGKGWYDYTK